jgi:hypothetical protein
VARPPRDPAAPIDSTDTPGDRPPDAAHLGAPRHAADFGNAVDGWLRELDLHPLERAERERIVSWDLEVDGRRRRDIRITLILDPGLALVAWVHYAPPLSDSFRKSYRQFLRWNDELPFVKFAIAEDERPVLVSEIPVTLLSAPALGLAIARLLAVCDLLLDESVGWLWPGARRPPVPIGAPRNERLLERFAVDLGELTGTSEAVSGAPEDA